MSPGLTGTLSGFVTIVPKNIYSREIPSFYYVRSRNTRYGLHAAHYSSICLFFVPFLISTVALITYCNIVNLFLLILLFNPVACTWEMPNSVRWLGFQLKI